MSEVNKRSILVPGQLVGPRDDRRRFLRGIAGLAIISATDPFGRSLLLREIAAGQRPLIPQTVPTTLGTSLTSSVSMTGSVPPTYVFTGTDSNPDDPGTWTLTTPAGQVVTNSFTKTLPGADGTTQTVTVAVTQFYSFTPPGTNTQTVSWQGSSWTITNSRYPTTWSVTITTTQSCTYTTTTTEGHIRPGGVYIETQGLAGQQAAIDHVDAVGLDMSDPRCRGGVPLHLRLACGVGA